METKIKTRQVFKCNGCGKKVTVVTTTKKVTLCPKCHRKSILSVFLKRAVKIGTENPKKFIHEFEKYSYYEWQDYLKNSEEVIPNNIKKIIRTQLKVEEKEMEKEATLWKYHPLFCLANIIIDEEKEKISWIWKGKSGDMLKEILLYIEDVGKVNTEIIVIVGWLCGFILTQRHKIEGISRYISLINLRRKNGRNGQV